MALVGFAQLKQPAASGSTFTDDFSSFTSGDDLDGSANYTELENTGGYKVEVNGSAQITLNVAAGTNSAQRLTYTGSLSGDQYAQLDIVNIGSATINVDTAVFCCVTDTNNYYQARIYGDGNWNVRKRVAGTNTPLGSGSASDFQNGDTFVLERDSTGSEVRLIRIRSATPTTMLTSTSQTDHTTGSAGLGMQQNGSSVTTPIADNFECGDL